MTDFFISYPASAQSPFLTVSYQSMRPALIILAVICAVLILSSLVLTALLLVKKRKAGAQIILLTVLYLAAVFCVVCTLFCYRQYRDSQASLVTTEPTFPTVTEAPTDTQQTTVPSTDAPTEAPTDPPPSFIPGHTDTSDPENWGITWEIMANGALVDSFTRTEPISFGAPEEYTALEGVITFRGDNYRSGATYGTANITQGTVSKVWARDISTLNGWSGSGWTGQPLIVRWDNATKAVMNLYPEKKEKDGLVEVIYATLDGHIYFYDLDDGSYTRDPLNLGMNFKGAGTLDPRGYPLMYVGSGDYVDGKSPRIYIISLIDGSVLYERSGSDPFCLRSWAAFDSTPLIDAETDTLIWPGENGVLYTFKLNTVYDQAAGTVSVTPEETAKARYTTDNWRWLGYEASAVVVDHYLYTSENGGKFFCIDLNTMELVWAQDTKDDSNSTPVFQWGEDGNGYIYTAPSLHWTADGNSKGSISIYKLDAQTGHIVWEKSYDCHTVSGVSGGVQSTPLLGKAGTDLEGLIIYAVARTPNVYDGVLVALDTETGEVVWELDMGSYAWSSPVALYTDSGKGYVVIGDSVGNLFLLDGITGTVLDTINLGSNIEASPAVFGDTLVVGTRGQQVYALKFE